MVTTREMLEAIKEDCTVPGASVKVGTDAYEDLRGATPEELLAAAVWSIRQSAGTKAAVDQLVSYLRAGFQLAQPGGWERIAPWWLRESRKQDETK
jgi:hypothetical protein